MNHLARIRATDPRGELRDGTEAVRLAERACQVTEYREPTFLNTLAAAYAESGRFEEAVTAATRAREQAVALGQQTVADLDQEMIQLFKARQPYRAGVEKIHSSP